MVQAPLAIQRRLRAKDHFVVDDGPNGVPHIGGGAPLAVAIEERFTSGVVGVMHVQGPTPQPVCAGAPPGAGGAGGGGGVVWGPRLNRDPPPPTRGPPRGGAPPGAEDSPRGR